MIYQVQEKGFAHATFSKDHLFECLQKKCKYIQFSQKDNKRQTLDDINSQNNEQIHKVNISFLYFAPTEQILANKQD